jgi:hypothetical protein
LQWASDACHQPDPRLCTIKGEQRCATTLYRYRLDGKAALYPDLASRFQPQGPHGPSQVIAPDIFDWHDCGWRGVPLAGQVIAPDKSSAYAIIGVGGFLGIGEYQVAVPFNQFKGNDDKFVLPGATKETMNAIPSFDCGH